MFNRPLLFRRWKRCAPLRYRRIVVEPLESRTLLSLAGLKSVGPTGDYTTLTAAIADIQSQGLSGPFTLELQSGYQSSSETFPINFSNLPGSSAANTLTVRPDGGATNLAIVSSTELAIL